MPIAPEAVGAALLDGLAAIADDQAVAVVLEDLHWAVPTTIEFAHRLARRARSGRMLLVLTARDSQPNTSVRDLATSPHLRTLNLGPLDCVEVENLLGSIAELPPDGMGQRLAGWLAECTGGIPLYVLEQLKQLFDTGDLAVCEGRWQAGERLRLKEGATTLLPPSRGILQARLDTLGSGALEVLEALAVWGREARAEVLEQLLGLSEADLAEALEVLQRRQFVGRSEQDALVLHDEIAAAVARRVPESQRRSLHTVAAGLASAAAMAGRPDEWLVAARHAALAGEAGKAADFAARAAAAIEAKSGPAAGRELLQGFADTAPASVKAAVGEGLGPVLKGRWTARRWLAERDGAARRARIRFGVGAAAALVLGLLGVRILARPRPIMPLGGGFIAVGRVASGRFPLVRDVRALWLDSSFAVHTAPSDSLPPGVRAGFPSRAVRPDQRLATYLCNPPNEDPTRVCALEIATGRQYVLGRFEDDAELMDWLPDASAFVMTGSYYPPQGEYARALVLMDSAGRLIRAIVRGEPNYIGAALAPAGDRLIAIPPDTSAPAALISLEGRTLRTLEWCSGQLYRWSPDGERFSCLVGQPPHSLVAVGRVDHAGLLRAEVPGTSSAGLEWSPDGRFVIVGAHDTATTLYVFDALLLGAPRAAAMLPPGFTVLGWVESPRALPSRVRIGRLAGPLVPGARVPLAVHAFDASGRAIGRAPAVVWTLLDSSVVHAGLSGALTADRPGTTKVIARFGLTIADTAVVRVESHSPRLLLAEDFDRGLDESRWKPYGDPAPRVLPGLGRNRSGGFNNNGDQAHFSGIVYRTRLATSKGLTVEYWAHTRLTGSLWQASAAMLRSADPDSFRLGHGAPLSGPDSIAVAAAAPNEGSPTRPKLDLVAENVVRSQDMPVRLRDGKWHRFRLVVYPSGEVRWFADGVELVRPVWVDLSRLPLATLDIGGRSVGTLAMVDDAKVWQGVVLDPPARR